MDTYPLRTSLRHPQRLDPARWLHCCSLPKEGPRYQRRGFAYGLLPFCLRRNPFHLLAESYALIASPEQRLMVFHHDLPALAIEHEAGRAFARICPERSTVERFYRRCPNAETREAAFATSIPYARHSSMRLKASAGSDEAARHGLPRPQTSQRPASILPRSDNWDNVALATDVGAPRCSHKTYETRVAGSYLWLAPLHEQSRSASALLQIGIDF